MYDFLKKGVEKRHFAYLASVAIDGASDNAPHWKLVETLLGLDLDGYLSRFIRTWFVSRRFKLRLLTPLGRCLSELRGTPRGLLQGGAPSPYIWLLHFNCRAGRLRSMHDSCRVPVGTLCAWYWCMRITRLLR